MGSPSIGPERHGGGAGRNCKEDAAREIQESMLHRCVMAIQSITCLHGVHVEYGGTLSKTCQN